MQNQEKKFKKASFEPSFIFMHTDIFFTMVVISERGMMDYTETFTFGQPHLFKL